MRRWWLMLIGWLTLLPAAQAQQLVSGKVVDSLTGQPLPFVHVLVEDNAYKGMVTDLDGWFEMEVPAGTQYITVKYVGYATRRIPAAALQDMVIAMVPGGIQLDELEVRAGENPAHRIIRNVLDFRSQHNPLNYDNFSYQSYDKLLLSSGYYLKETLLDTTAAWLALAADTSATAAADTTADTTAVTDTTESFFDPDSMYLFIMETVSQRNFVSPGKDVTKVIATQASGFRMPELYLLATELQPFTFYEDRISLLGNRYVNPISSGTYSRYFFHIQDTLYDGTDTVFVISYKPYAHRSFPGLEGLLYVHSDRWAIQRLTATPVNVPDTRIKVWQEYERLDGRWFPVRLHADLAFPGIIIGDSPAVATTRSYLREVKINESDPGKPAGVHSVRVLNRAEKKEADWWLTARTDSLSRKEQNTYQVIDSVSDAMNLERKVKWLLALTRGTLRTGMIDWPIDKWIRFNNFEGWRPGLAVRTNENMSSRVVAESYVAYGTRDRKWKYGLSGKVLLWPERDGWLSLRYHRDVFESGRQNRWLNGNNTSLLGRLRDYLVSDMYREEMVEGAFSLRLTRSLSVQPYIRQGFIQAGSDYLFEMGGGNGLSLLKDDFYLTETGVRLAWQPGQRLVRVGAQTSVLGNNPEGVWLNVRKGLFTPVGELNYLIVEGKVAYEKTWPGVMSTRFFGEFGWSNTSLPYFLQFMPNGIRRKNAIYVVEQAFHTMPMHQYLGDKMAAVGVWHHWGTLFSWNDLVRPRLSTSVQALWSSLREPERQQEREFATASKGYYEAGVTLYDVLLLRSNIATTGFGIGAFYHLGPGGSAQWRDNTAIRLSLSIGF